MNRTNFSKHFSIANVLTQTREINQTMTLVLTTSLGFPSKQKEKTQATGYH